MKKEENYGIFSAMEFASYIKYKFNELKPNVQNISPLKLQKSLYFCFAYWGAFAYKGNKAKNEISDQKFDEYLFNDEIEAWVYGPVVPTVYRNSDKIEICNPVYFLINSLAGLPLLKFSILAGITFFSLHSLQHLFFSLFPIKGSGLLP